MKRKSWSKDTQNRRSITVVLYSRRMNVKDQREYPWLDARQIAKMMGWSESKARYWLNKLIASHTIIWRLKPNRYGWFTTIQYAHPMAVRYCDSRKTG